MAFINKGLAKGLSYVNNWQQDIGNAIRNEEMDRLARKEREQKVQYYADLMQEGQAFDQYNNSRLEDYFKSVNDEIAGYVLDNPDFETDINKMKKFRSIARKYQDNSILNESRRVQEEYQTFKEHYQKNPELWTDEEFQRENDKYLNYINQDPGSNKKTDPYTFIPPMTITPADVIIQHSQLFSTRPDIIQTYDSRGVPVNKQVEYVDPADLEAATLGVLSNKKHRKVMEVAWQKMFNENGKPPEAYPSLKKFISEQLLATKRRGTLGLEVDSMALMQAKYQSQRKNTRNYYMEQIHNNLGLNSSIPNAKAYPLTGAGEQNGVLPVDPASGMVNAYIAPGAYKDTDSAISNMNYVYGLEGNVKVINTHRILEDSAGKRWVEATIEAPMPKGTTEEYWKEQGLQVQSPASKYEGLDISMPILDVAGKERKITGTVIVPAIETQQSIDEYNLQYTTKDKLNYLGEESQYATGRGYNPYPTIGRSTLNNSLVTELQNPQAKVVTPKERLSLKDEGIILSPTKEYGYDPATGTYYEYGPYGWIKSNVKSGNKIIK